jgi:hypothetical protein
MVASDATQLTNSGKDLNMHPLYLTLANIPRDERNHAQNEAIVMSALFPAFPKGTPTESNRDDYRAAKREMMQRCLHTFFKELISLSKHGVTMTGPGNRVYHVYPILWGLSLDHLEAVKYMGVKLGWCTSCEVHPNQFSMSSQQLAEIGVSGVRPRTNERMKTLAERAYRDRTSTDNQYGGVYPLAQPVSFCD